MKSILAIQFREKKESLEAEQKSLLRSVEGTDTQLTFLNALDTSIKWENPQDILDKHDGVILCGSGEFYFDGKLHPEDPKRARVYERVEKMRPFIQRILSTDFPTLGLCMGHQVIAHTTGASIIACDETGKTGTFGVHLSEDGLQDRLFEGFPEEFLAQYAHKDVVSELPKGAVALANGEKCTFSIIRYGENVYTVQFHPELTDEEMYGRMEVHPEYLPENANLSKIVKEAPESNTLIPLFVERIVATK